MDLAQQAQARRAAGQAGVVVGTGGQRRQTPYHDEYYTPPHIVAALGEFDLDPCAGPVSTLARECWRPPADGLAREWHGRVWLNPPYSSLLPWLERFLAHGNGITLVNTRMETLWAQRLLAAAAGVLLLRGRVRFVGAGDNSPIGSMLVALGERNLAALRACTLPGCLLLPDRISNLQCPVTTHG